MGQIQLLGKGNGVPDHSTVNQFIPFLRSNLGRLNNDLHNLGKLITISSIFSPSNELPSLMKNVALNIDKMNEMQDIENEVKNLINEYKKDVLYWIIFVWKRLNTEEYRNFGIEMSDALQAIPRQLAEMYFKKNNKSYKSLSNVGKM